MSIPQGLLLGFLAAVVIGLGLLTNSLRSRRSSSLSRRPKNLLWLGILAAITIAVFWSLDVSVTESFDGFFADEMLTWAVLGLIGVAGGVVLFVFRRNDGLNFLKSVAALVVMAALFGFIITFISASYDNGNVSCSTGTTMFKTEISEQPRFVRLLPGEVHILDVPLGREKDLVVTFADTPFEGQPSLELGNVSNYVAVDTPFTTASLAGGHNRLTTAWEGYRGTVGNNCLAYYVSLSSEPESEANE